MYKKFDVRDYQKDPSCGCYKKFQKGGLVYQIWKEKTGLDWSEAKKRGYTDGSYEQNIALMEKLKSGNFTLNNKGKTLHPALQSSPPKSNTPLLPFLKEQFDKSFKDKAIRFEHQPMTYGEKEVVYHRKPSAPVKPIVLPQGELSKRFTQNDLAKAMDYSGKLGTNPAKNSQNKEYVIKYLINYHQKFLIKVPKKSMRFQ